MEHRSVAAVVGWGTPAFIAADESRRLNRSCRLSGWRTVCALSEMRDTRVSGGAFADLLLTQSKRESCSFRDTNGQVALIPKGDCT
jgi:hypothetical protein